MSHKVKCILLALSLVLSGCSWLEVYEQKEFKKDLVTTGSTRVIGEEEIPLTLNMESNSTIRMISEEGDLLYFSYTLKSMNETAIQIVYDKETYIVEYAKSKDIGPLNIYYNGIVDVIGLNKEENKRFAIVMLKKEVDE